MKPVVVAVLLENVGAVPVSRADPVWLADATLTAGFVAVTVTWDDAPLLNPLTVTVPPLWFAVAPLVALNV